MNDRYLFRGKRIDNGEWVQGHLITDEQDEKKCFIAYIFGTDEDGQPHDIDSALVDPSTVCQCTGLKDKKGKLIFENDIVGVRFDGEEKMYEVGSVEYGAFNCSCCDGVYGWYFTDSGDIREVEKYEVIGNVFDNPELLEVQE